MKSLKAVELVLAGLLVVTYIITAAMLIHAHFSQGTAYVYYLPAPFGGRYEYQIFVSFVGAAAAMVPFGLRKIFRINIPAAAAIVCNVFVFFGIFLGEILRFYYIVPYFDTFLHVFSGAALCMIGFSLVRFWGKRNPSLGSLSPGIVAIFAFCFAMTLGMAWELVEFILDAIFDANAQKYALEDGTPLIGREALMDTMIDFFANTAGAIPAAIACALKINKKRKDAA